MNRLPAWLVLFIAAGLILALFVGVAFILAANKLRKSATGPQISRWRGFKELPATHRRVSRFKAVNGINGGLSDFAISAKRGRDGSR